MSHDFALMASALKVMLFQLLFSLNVSFTKHESYLLKKNLKINLKCELGEKPLNPMIED